MIAEKDPYIKSAYDHLQIISQDKQKRLEYEAREKAIRDHNQFLFEAEQRGIEIGEQHGIEIGQRRVNKLHSILLRHNRYDDLARSADDPEFQEQLMAEFGI